MAGSIRADPVPAGDSADLVAVLPVTRTPTTSAESVGRGRGSDVLFRVRLYMRDSQFGHGCMDRGDRHPNNTRISLCRVIVVPQGFC
jgi:hypothetical protein